MVSSTLKLGISILNGGNSDVQQVKPARESFWKPTPSSVHQSDGGQRSYVFCGLFGRICLSLFVCVQKMLDYLKDKKDVGFFLSVQALMQTCRSGIVLVVLL